MVNRITQPSGNRPLVDDNGIMTNETVAWVQLVTNRTLIVGTGSPEGVVDALQGAIFMDDAGTAGSILYVKRDSADGAGVKTNGWILV
jgi:hypothetical protein